MELGSARQLNQLREMQRTGRLGCFALTERLAGVNSGLVVHTTACWVCDDKDKAGGYFLLNTPHPGAKKNWISQGLTASLGVVVADLIVNGETVGPQYVLGLSRIPILFARARLTLSFIYRKRVSRASARQEQPAWERRDAD